MIETTYRLLAEAPAAILVASWKTPWRSRSVQHAGHDDRVAQLAAPPLAGRDDEPLETAELPQRIAKALRGCIRRSGTPVPDSGRAIYAGGVCQAKGCLTYGLFR